MKNQVSQLLYCEQSEAIDMLNFKWSNHFFTLDHCRNENIPMIQKGQVIGAKNHLSTFENFVMLMAE
ncbi:hypothetical protein [Cardinium endosymbiont of Oedothorax gibbosus]|uniref:hypothetical protein n=1 Tax=Cardinium endosymbiont of Oedothorax gibbosus TaxID=931101 RepID=UPI003F6ADE6C